MPRRADVDNDFIGYGQEQHAWVLQAPLDVRNRKMSGGREIVFTAMDCDLEGHFVWIAVQRHDTADFHREIPLENGMACGVPRLEADFRIPLDLEDRLPHLIVPHADAGLCAGGVDDDGSRAAAGLRVDTNLAALELEGTFRVVRKA